MNVTLFSHHIPASVARSDPRVKSRFLEFFTAQIRNPNTRRSYAKATIEFLRWCETWGATSLPSIAPMHVAGWIEEMTHTHSAPTVKQRLATVRHPFDWLVTGQVMATIPPSRCAALPIRAGLVKRPCWRRGGTATPRQDSNTYHYRRCFRR
jgi:site-specific recombinase XerD